MTRPVGSDLHVSRMLTNMAVGFARTQEGYVADKVFPNVPVSKRSDLYYVFDRSDFYRGEMKERAPSTESQGVGWTLSESSYWIPVLALHQDIDDQTRAQADDIFALDEIATNVLTNHAYITREKKWVKAYFQAGVWPLQLRGVAAAPGSGEFLKWSDANSTPIEDVRQAKRTQHLASGFKPNVAVAGGSVIDTLLDHPDIIDRLKAGQTPGGPAQANVNTLAALFGVEEILIADALENLSPEGLDPVFSYIAGNHFLLLYRPGRAPSMQLPSAGYTFSWTGYLGATRDGMRMSKMRMDPIKSDRIEIEMAYIQMQIMKECAFMFLDAV